MSVLDRRSPCYGKLEVFYGGMKSRKTSRLLYIIDSYICFKKRVLYINSSVDTRETLSVLSCISSHNKFLCPSITFDQIKVTNLSEIGNAADYDFIAVDECQFFEDLVVVVMKWIRNGVNVSVAGLDLDYEGNPFGQTLQLARNACTQKKMKGYCEECIRNGETLIRNSTHTKRVGVSKEKILIDDSKYEASCFFHFEQRT